jgi:hypothetical protein
MKIYQGELTPDQIAAGLGVMKGRFKCSQVMKALSDAGVEHMVSGADVLIGKALRSGRIRRITQGIYQAD